MATSLLALLDDITTVLDDISVMTKIAAKKGAGVLGDDLALNAQQVSGVNASRELPVVWAVAKGSLLNKAILVPSALLISALVPWAVTPLLILGGTFLCYEGIEKVVHKLLERGHAGSGGTGGVGSREVEPEAGPVKHQAVAGGEKASGHAGSRSGSERHKIRGAIRTDFVLSAEIVVITLGTVSSKPFVTQLGVLVVIALLMTVGVYGLVAGIVKLDDAGLALSTRANALARSAGRTILLAAPWLMRGLSVVGTAAMFLVGGGILVHGIEPLHHVKEQLIHGMVEPAHTGLGVVFDLVTGVLLGVLALGAVSAVRRIVRGGSR